MASLFVLMVAFSLALPLVTITRELLRQRFLGELRALAVTERNRNRFGALRTRLLALARSGEVSVNSDRFLTLYGALTTLMRNPHDYDAAARQFLTIPPTALKPIQLTSHERELFIDLGHRLDLLCRDYSSVYRYAAKIIDWIRSHRPGVEVHSAPLWVLMIRNRALKVKRLDRVQEASKRFSPERLQLAA